MFTKWRTRWPPKHEIPKIFFDIRARIIILVWGVKEFIKHVKIDLKAHRLHKLADRMADEATGTILNVRKMYILVPELKSYC